LRKEAGDDDLDGALRAFGLPPDALDALPPDADDDCEVWPENWDALLVFLACQTQWVREIPAMASKILWSGLSYHGVAVVIKMHGYRGKKARELFSDVQIMERAALAVLNK
jgi:hypothetical protein